MVEKQLIRPENMNKTHYFVIQNNVEKIFFKYLSA